jgi:hypothetical protein
MKNSPRQVSHAEVQGIYQTLFPEI